MSDTNDDVLLVDFSHGGQSQCNPQVCAQSLVHFLLSHSHNPMGRLFETIGEKSGAVPTALSALRGTEKTHTHTHKQRFE